MPWTRKQIKTALAVEHNWKPTGSARNFGKTVKSGAHKGMSLASTIASESGYTAKGHKKRGKR